MIVEGAFLKLPELLETSLARDQVREATVIHAMATAVLIELNGRNIEHPTQHVVVEKPFAGSGVSSSYRADLYVHLSGAVSRPELVAGYGYRENCWVECKAFLGPSGRHSAIKRRPDDIGRVIRDILRVCLFPEELQGAIRQNARYLLMVGASDPAEFWNGPSMRAWASKLTLPGEHEIEIPIASLNPTAMQTIGSIKDVKQLPDIRLVVFNLTFRPDMTASKGFSRYWGSLSRIMRFTMHTDTWCVDFEDRADMRWESHQNEQLGKAREEMAALLASKTA
jgi:hypothetical protein